MWYAYTTDVWILICKGEFYTHSMVTTTYWSQKCDRYEYKRPPISSFADIGVICYDSFLLGRRHIIPSRSTICSKAHPGKPKPPNLCMIDLCVGKPVVTGCFRTQLASNMESVLMSNHCQYLTWRCRCQDTDEVVELKIEGREVWMWVHMKWGWFASCLHIFCWSLSLYIYDYRILVLFSPLKSNIKYIVIS